MEVDVSPKKLLRSIKDRNAVPKSMKATKAIQPRKRYNNLCVCSMAKGLLCTAGCVMIYRSSSRRPLKALTTNHTHSLYADTQTRIVTQQRIIGY